MPSGNLNITPLFDSNQFRWADMSFSIFGSVIEKILELTYDVDEESEELYGAGDEPFEISSGNRKYSGQLSIYKTVFDTMNLAAKAAGYRDILAVRFPITCSYTNDVAITTDILMNVKLGKFNGGGQQNDKSIKITLPFKFTRIRTV